MATQAPRVWLITGASSGFGRALTEFVLNQGDIAVATLRRPEMLKDLRENYSEEKLLVLRVDVTNQADIDHAFARTKEVFGRLDVVFNNAGYAVLGYAEFTPIEAARGMFDVNFWGAANVSCAAIKFFREVNEPGRGGVLLQNASIVGIDGSPYVTYYSASKHALAGFSAGLAKELLPKWNIKVCIIEPGAFSTSVLRNATYMPENSVYVHELGDKATPTYNLEGDPAKFAKAVYLLAQSERLPLHLPIGQDAVAEARKKVESLEEEILDAAPWSIDLLHDVASSA